MTTTTRPSLLERLRNPADQVAWEEFDAQYRELIVRYCRRSGLPHSDSEDVCQGVMIAMARTLPRFEYSREKGRFRGYLARSVHRAVRTQMRRRLGDSWPVDDEHLADLESGDDRHDRVWEQEWEDHHLRLAMRTIRATHHPRSVAAFDLILAGSGPSAVAEELGLTVGNVRKIKQRIGERLAALVEQQLGEEG